MFFPKIFSLTNSANVEIRTFASKICSLILSISSAEHPFEKISSSELSIYIKKCTKSGLEFIERLENPDYKLDYEAIKIPLVNNFELRAYQKKGIAWMKFLATNSLNGLLCDDMGLGKTIQTLCSIFLVKQESSYNFPSLIICPSTLVKHWSLEIANYFEKNHFKSHIFSQNLKISSLNSSDIVLASYSNLKKKDSFFDSKWLYIVLDEGHLIKNPNLKLTENICGLESVHKLILTGTPIQNNVWELFSLFKFILPGYLGEMHEFKNKFAKPINNLKPKTKQNMEFDTQYQDNSEAVLEKLHKITLPFILRRTKEQVLEELPPKVIQDVYCSLHELQLKIYEILFSQSIDTMGQYSLSEMENKGFLHQISVLRKLCVHPSFINVENPKISELINKEYAEISEENFLLSSGKLKSFFELLLANGFVSNNESEKSVNNNPENNQMESFIDEMEDISNKVIVFYQLKATMELIRKFMKCFFQKYQYMEINSSIPAMDRVEVAEKFNSDASCKIIFICTKIGGLGLNLTSANIVIFLEHDWNPVNDLQAMDRAHRLGQKKTVIVHRLITSDTLEEKIMGIQQFKRHIANSIINEDNEKVQKPLENKTEGGIIENLINSRKETEKSLSNNSKRAKVAGDSGEAWDIPQILWNEDEYDF